MIKKLVAWVALAAAAITLAACTGERVSPAPGSPATGVTVTPAVTPAAEPVTVEAAQAAAEKEFGAYAAGDWVGAWDLWTAEGQKAISRDEYARLHAECKTLTGVPFEVTGARLEGEGRAVVTFKRLIAAGKADMRYEDGKWRYQPEQDDLADYAKGVNKILAERRAAGGCRG